MIDFTCDRVIEMADLQEAKYKHRIVSCNSKIYVIGGFSEGHVRSNTVHKYDLDFNRWF